MSTLATLSALDDYTSSLIALQGMQREELPRAANGQAIAPSDQYAAQVMKDIASGKSAEFRRLLAAWICNLRDGAALEVVKLPLRRLEAILDVEAGAYRPRSVVALSRRETREQCQVDLAQLRIPADENDLEALEHLVRELASYLGVAMELKAEAERRVALLSTPRVPSRVRTVQPARRSLSAGSLIRLK